MIGMNLVRRYTKQGEAKPGGAHRRSEVVSRVEKETTEAAEIARIAGQHRLTDPRTNPAVRAYADELRNEEHRKVLAAQHGRVVRRHRVEDRRAGHAERALEAIQEARETRSPAKSVLALHARRKLYMRMSMVTSVALAGGSAMGLEKIAEDYKNIPTGTGYIVEVGLTWLATMVIQARADFVQHGGTLEKKDWRNAALWALMIVPLAASMAANVHGHNVLGALCAAGAAAFSLFAYIVSDLFATAAKKQAQKVTDNDEDQLRDIASGKDLSSSEEPATAHQTFFEAQGLSFVPVKFQPRKVLVSKPLELTHGSETSAPDPSRTRSENGSGDQRQTQVPDPDPNGSETHDTDRSEKQVPDPQDKKVPDPEDPDRSEEKVPDQVPPDKPQTRKTQTGPKKRTRAKAKPKALDRLDEARAVDQAYFDEHGRHIPAEKLARALRIAKPAALELVKQVRGGHIDVAKAVNQ